MEKRLDRLEDKIDKLHDKVDANTLELAGFKASQKWEFRIMSVFWAGLVTLFTKFFLIKP